MLAINLLELAFVGAGWVLVWGLDWGWMCVGERFGCGGFGGGPGGVSPAGGGGPAAAPPPGPYDTVTGGDGLESELPLMVSNEAWQENSEGVWRRLFGKIRYSEAVACKTTGGPNNFPDEISWGRIQTSAAKKKNHNHKLGWK